MFDDDCLVQADPRQRSTMLPTLKWIHEMAPWCCSLPRHSQGKAKSPSFREHDVTHLCVVLYLHATHEYNLISAPLTGCGMETKRRKQFIARKCVSKWLNNRNGTFNSDYVAIVDDGSAGLSRLTLSWANVWYSPVPSSLLWLHGDYTHSSPAGCWSGSRVSTNYSGGKMRGNDSTMLPDHNSRDLYNNWLFMHMW